MATHTKKNASRRHDDRNSRSAIRKMNRIEPLPSGTQDRATAPGSTSAAGASIRSVRPSRMDSVTSARCASSRSWVTRTTVARRRRFTSISRSTTCAPVLLSRLPVGSSASRIGGAFASARAIATRCCSPPESCDG